MAMTRYQVSAPLPPIPVVLAILRAYQASQNPATWLLQINLAADPGGRGAGHPDRPLIVGGHVHSPPPAEHGALARDVRQRRPAAGLQPLGERGVKAAGDRVLDRRAADREERAHLVSEL